MKPLALRCSFVAGLFALAPLAQAQTTAFEYTTNLSINNQVSEGSFIPPLYPRTWRTP